MLENIFPFCDPDPGKHLKDLQERVNQFVETIWEIVINRTIKKTEKTNIACCFRCNKKDSIKGEIPFDYHPCFFFHTTEACHGEEKKEKKNSVR